mgnify:CR=1 FL=1
MKKKKRRPEADAGFKLSKLTSFSFSSFLFFSLRFHLFHSCTAAGLKANRTVNYNYSAMDHHWLLQIQPILNDADAQGWSQSKQITEVDDGGASEASKVRVERNE